MEEKIGLTAGRVWHYLNEHKEASVGQLVARLDESANLINQSLGWLAREGKLNFVQKGTSVRVSLK